MPPKKKPTASTSDPSTSKSKAKATSSRPHRSPSPPVTTITGSTNRNTAAPDDSESTTPSFPPHLISRILHSFLTDETTRISNAAVSSVSEYTRTFVREAIYRAVAEREKRQGKQGSGGIAGYVELEVEDLERVGPQLMLDF